MSTHQSNPEMLPDDLFVQGALKFLVVGNECRLLDKRRTPGIIRSIDMEAGFFRWEIVDFEDRGKYWDVEFERVETYQFQKNSIELPTIEINRLIARISEVNKFTEIKVTETNKTELMNRLKTRIAETSKWLKKNSKFLASNEPVDFQNRKGPKLLREDLNAFMLSNGMVEMESRTAETQVLNPHSGDWIKAMQIVMAEMGLKAYRGREVRSTNAFLDIGSKDNLRNYIECRISFLRAFFDRIGMKDVELYRGMSTEWDWRPDVPNHYRFWSSWTFNYEVAQDFSELKPGSRYKNSYLIKRAIPVERLFMTYLETDAMNRQYSEAEALVLHEDDDRMLW